MANGFKFKLTAQHYGTAVFSCSAPFEIILAEDDPRVPLFRNPCFKEEPMILPDDFGKSRESSEPPPDGEQKSGDDDPKLIPLSEIEGISPEVVKQIQDAGFESAQAVATITPEKFDLTTLKGVGEATAAKIVKACADAVAAAESSEPPPDGEQK